MITPGLPVIESHTWSMPLLPVEATKLPEGCQDTAYAAAGELALRSTLAIGVPLVMCPRYRVLVPPERGFQIWTVRSSLADATKRASGDQSRALIMLECP